MTLPQKPSEVYDCINNVYKIIQPPTIKLENYSNYRDNYYKAFNSKDKAFNKHLGYFSYFNEKTRREREMNELYSRKNYNKFAGKLKDGSKERKDQIPKLKNVFMDGKKENFRYGARKMSETDKELKMEIDKKRSETDPFLNRRGTNVS